MSSRDARAREGAPRRWHRLAGGLAVAALALGAAGCDTNTTFTRLGMPVPVTKQGHTIVTLWQGSWVAAWAVGALVWGLIVWAVVFHRKRAGHDAPQQVRYNLPIEMLYTVVPFIMVGVLFFFTARDENYVDSLPAHPDVVVNVIGYQWSWQFQYPQYKVPSQYGDVTVTGQQWNPNGGNPVADNAPLPLLEIPSDESIRFNLYSTDVIHAFWIVPFEFKRDVIPGHPNHFQVDTTRNGYFIGRCTELCGLYHSRMLFKVRIVPPAQFHSWVLAMQATQTRAAHGTTAQTTSAGSTP